MINTYWTTLQKLEDLEEQLKQSQFKQYLAQNAYQTQSESQVERPYSVNRDPYPSTFDLDSNFEAPKSHFTPLTSQNKPKAMSTLQVMYYGNKTPNLPKQSEKKGFNITKKRKLYNEKDFQDL